MRLIVKKVEPCFFFASSLWIYSHVWPWVEERDFLAFVIRCKKGVMWE